MTVACLALATQAGCTALLSATALREAVRDSTEAQADAEHEVKDAVAAADSTDKRDRGAVTAANAPAHEPSAAEPETDSQPSTTSDALDAAIDRLAAAGRLDDDTQAALLAQLEDAPQQDWPLIIDAFVGSIESNRVAFKHVSAEKQPEADPLLFPADDAVAAPPPIELPATVSQPVHQTAAETPATLPAPDPIAADPATVATPVVAAATIEPTPAIEPVAPHPLATLTAAVPQLIAVSAEPAVEEAAAETEELPAAQGQPELTVINACFASRVRAWGVVDRFTASHFRPGQDVIVYFELENLAVAESDVGHSTRIDTALRLETPDGRRLHEWHFEPVEETCHARRRDYFARYVLRIPDDVPAGECRLHVAVSDEIAGQTAHESLPLNIADR